MAALDLIQTAASEWPKMSALLSVVGALRISLSIFRLASVLLQTFVLPGTDLKKFGARKGAWAVITGASDGIGKEFSLQLAKAGFNIFLVARNKSKLESVASEIHNKYPAVSTRVHTIDFSLDDDAAYATLAAVLENLEIGVLVNNAGTSQSIPAYFSDVPPEEIKNTVSVNVNGTLRVTYIVLPGMTQRKRGLILNIGSFAGAVPTAMIATYAGTKGFVATFSTALAEEIKQHNIVVEHVNTYFVVSNMSKIQSASTVVPTSAAYVRSVLAKVGLACGAAQSGRPNTSTPYWTHALIDYMMSVVGIPSLFIRQAHKINLQRRKERLGLQSKAK
ncbi:3-ketoacyl-CoA reductase [Amanita muscaria]